MRLQNRVFPTGEIVAHPARGGFTSNRGVLHRPDRTRGSARWKHKAWICCTLHWKDVRRQVMAPGRWTELFFLDEAVALTAGHRPCAYCRRAAFRRFQAAWARAFGHAAKAPEIDAALHAARIRPGTREQQRHARPAASLPNGCFVLIGISPHLVADGQAWPWQPEGYLAPRPLPTGLLSVLTPAPTVAVLGAGYEPHLAPRPEQG